MPTVMEQLAKELIKFGMKADGTPSTSPDIYAENGLFGRCDGNMTLVNAMVGPVGFEGMLNWRGTDTQREMTDALVEVSESGTEQTAACGNCKTASLKAAAQQYFFGRFCRQSEELQFDNLGLRANSSIPIKNLFGSITDAMGNEVYAMNSEITDEFAIQTRLAGYFLALKNAQMLWTGNPANNDGAYQEYKGLELIVNTGKYDVYTQDLSPALDSFLMDYGSNAVTGQGTYAIQNWFRRVMLQFSTRAAGAGLDWNTATCYIVMHPNNWEGIAKRYAIDGMDLAGDLPEGGRLNIDASLVRDRHEEYLSRQALPINGRWYPVVLDSQLPQSHGQANGSVSDIYFLTTEINGMEILYGEYQDFDMTFGRIHNELSGMFGGSDIVITDNGRFAVIKSESRGCFDVQTLVKPRLVAIMPWLCARIQNVANSVLQSPLPDVSGSGGIYEQGGGRTSIPMAMLY